MAEKKVRNGFVARMIAAIYGALCGVSFLATLADAEDAVLLVVGFILLSVIYCAMVAFAILGKKKKLFNTLYLVGLLVSLVVLFATQTWGYYALGTVIIVIFGLVGYSRGNKALKTSAE